MNDRPTTAELLETIADVLEGEVLPTTAGALQHRVRVAGNLCRILEREARLGDEIEARERSRLGALLDRADAGSANLLELNRELVKRLDAGGDPEFEGAAWRALLDITRDKLRIAKPGHDRYDFAAEVRP